MSFSDARRILGVLKRKHLKGPDEEPMPWALSGALEQMCAELDSRFIEMGQRQDEIISALSKISARLPPDEHE